MSKREARLARQAALEAQKGRQRMIRIGAIAAAAIVMLGGITWLVVTLARRQPEQAAEADPSVTAEEIDVPSEGASHLPFGQKATYQHYPPSSGSHWNQQGVAPTAWGYYEDALPPEVYVHNLEHGGIVILYNCPDGCPDTVEALKKFVGQAPPSRLGTQKVVVTPDSQIATKIVALAWTRQLNLSDLDGARLLEFYKRWVDLGPELAP